MTATHKFIAKAGMTILVFCLMAKFAVYIAIIGSVYVTFRIMR